jgi:hypothetical protein
MYGQNREEEGLCERNREKARKKKIKKKIDGEG